MGRLLTISLATLRYRDVFIFEAPAIVGLAFSIPEITLVTAGKATLFFLACFLLMAHIFYFNDWSDSSLDSNVVEKSDEFHLKQGVARQDMFLLSIISGVAGLSAFALLSSSLFIISLSILVLGIIYSFPDPRFKGKAMPVLSSVLHILGGVLTFMLGYAEFSLVDLRGLYIGGYFALLLTSGHLIQEVRDHLGDLENEISTNAVHFGPKTIFLLGCLLFMGSFAYLYLLAQAQWIPSVLKYLALLSPIFAIMALKSFGSGLTYAEMGRFRAQYRIFFGIIVVIMVVVTLFYRF